MRKLMRKFNLTRKFYLIKSLRSLENAGKGHFLRWESRPGNEPRTPHSIVVHDLLAIEIKILFLKLMI